MISKGHTLWLKPTGSAYQRFSGLIKKLAAEYQAPVFEPHVTLLGEIMLPAEECLQKAKELVSEEKSFIINLTEIGCQDVYFRALFIYAKKINPYWICIIKQKKYLI